MSGRRLQLNAVHHLVPLGDGTWRMTGSDPQFLVPGPFARGVWEWQFRAGVQADTPAPAPASITHPTDNSPMPRVCASVAAARCRCAHAAFLAALRRDAYCASIRRTRRASWCSVRSRRGGAGASTRPPARFSGRRAATALGGVAAWVRDLAAAATGRWLSAARADGRFHHRRRQRQQRRMGSGDCRAARRTLSPATRTATAVADHDRLRHTACLPARAGREPARADVVRLRVDRYSTTAAATPTRARRSRRSPPIRRVTLLRVGGQPRHPRRHAPRPRTRDRTLRAAGRLRRLPVSRCARDHRRGAAARANYPALVYSDEDKLRDGRHVDPFEKPDWDPVLFRNCCYIAHLCAIRRERGATPRRLFRSGRRRVPRLGHLPALRARRTAARCTCRKFSTAGACTTPLRPPTSTPRTSSINSQRHVLERHLRGDRAWPIASASCAVRCSRRRPTGGSGASEVHRCRSHSCCTAMVVPRRRIPPRPRCMPVRMSRRSARGNAPLRLRRWSWRSTPDSS